jgi:hypothetical protein
LFAQWVIYLDWKKKFAGLGGVKGGLHEYILHQSHGDSLWIHRGSSRAIEANFGAMEADPGSWRPTLELPQWRSWAANPAVLEAHPGSRGLPWTHEAHPGATETHPGITEAHPGAMEAHLGAIETKMEQALNDI